MKTATTSAIAIAAVMLALTMQPAGAQDVIKIGVITDKVGPAKPYADPVMQGVVLGAKEINAAGGVLGKKLELMIEDDQGKPDVSATMARKVVDAGAVFILSVSLTTATQQAETVSLETKTPHLTPSNSGDTLTTNLENPYFWQTGPLGSTQIATMMAYARNKAFKRVAIATDDSDLGQLTTRFFKAGLEKAGVQIVDEEVVPGGATSAEPQMQKIRAAQPEALFMAGVVTPPNVLMLKAYRQLGLTMPMLGGYNFSVPIYLSVAKGLLEGLAFVDAYDPQKPEVKRFIEGYKKEYGSEPYNLHGYGYDGIKLVANAITRAGSTDKEKIRVAMQATKGLVGVMGAQGANYEFRDGKRTGFDPNGMVVRVMQNDKQGPVVHTGVR